MITNFFKRTLKLILALIIGMVLFGGILWALPALAGHGVKLSPLGVGAPDIEINSDGSMVALAYYKRGANSSVGGAVYLKAADEVNGWRTSPNALGFTRQSPRLAFSSTTTSTVYAVWIDADNTSVKYARCTISAIDVPDCPETGTVYETADTLDTPDVAIDGNHNIHIAWANVDDRSIQTILINSSQTLPLTGTVVNRTPGTDEQFLQPKLTASGNWVHLAYLSDPNTIDNGGILDPQKVVYVRSNNSSLHSWQNKKEFTVGALVAGHDQFGHPTIAADGAKIYLAWESLTSVSPPSPQYVLLGAQSLDTGATWPNPNPKYITSDVDPSTVGPAGSSALRLSTNGGTPGEEDGMRPSVAISPTGFALAWQERQNDPSCGGEGGGNRSSEIYSAYTSASWSAEEIVTDDTVDEYAIAPDITVAPDSTRHVAFMQSSSENCVGGDITEYAIYYIGPFTVTSNDQGEGGVFLPIIMKNS